MTYSVPILIQTRNDLYTPQYSSGTGVLLAVGSKRWLVTAKHVIDQYHMDYVKDAATLFRLGDPPINPTRRLLSEDRTSDLAVLDLRGARLPERPHDSPAIEFFVPSPWPGNDATVGDRVFFGGWPGAYREVKDRGLDVYIGYDSVVNVPVTLATDHEFHLKFNRSAWTSLSGDPKKPADYIQDRRMGGHSGAGVFRISPTGERPELVGFVREYREDDAIICCPITKMRTDGTVKPSSIGYRP